MKRTLISAAFAICATSAVAEKPSVETCKYIAGFGKLVQEFRQRGDSHELIKTAISTSKHDVEKRYVMLKITSLVFELHPKNEPSTSVETGLFTVCMAPD